MQNQQRSSLADDLKQLRADAQQAGEQQEKIQQALDKLSQESPGNGNNGSPQANSPEQMMKQFQKARQILQEKAELNKALSGIEQDLFGSAQKAATQQKSASQQLQSAGNSMRATARQAASNSADGLTAPQVAPVAPCATAMPCSRAGATAGAGLRR